jgi:PHD/YefM family antitoxin component YafN of YafNO toxin-antitoxin module
LRHKAGLTTHHGVKEQLLIAADDYESIQQELEDAAPRLQTFQH